MKTYLQNHLVPYIYTDMTSIMEIGKNMYAQCTSAMLADKFALYSFNISQQGPQANLKSVRCLFSFQAPSVTTSFVQTAHLKGSAAPACFYLQAKMFLAAEAISIAAGRYGRLAGLTSVKVARGEVLRLDRGNVNRVIFTRSKHIHLLALKKGGNYGWINFLCLHRYGLNVFVEWV